MADMNGWKLTGKVFYSEDGNKALVQPSFSETILTVEKTDSEFIIRVGDVSIRVSPKEKIISF